MDEFEAQEDICQWYWYWYGTTGRHCTSNRDGTLGFGSPLASTWSGQCEAEARAAELPVTPGGMLTLSAWFAWLGAWAVVGFT